MIKIVLSLLLFLNTHELLLARGVLEELIPQAQEMLSLIKSAKECEVIKRNDSLVFCTGFELSKEDLRFLKKLDFIGCKNFLRQAGNEVVDAQLKKRPKNVREEVWTDFFSTTKLALILHKKKIILFKNEARRGDCLHETLHYYQRSRRSYTELSPRSRSVKQNLLQVGLEKAITIVESFERKGEKKKAQDLAKNLQPFINLQREWINIGQWLDEKEIYQAFLDFPQDLDLNERDRDIALANLLRLKNSLSWKLSERVTHLGQLALTKKYKNVETPTIKEFSSLESEMTYQEKYHKGIISRESYEEKVIALRKYQANSKIATSKNLMGKLEGSGLKRDFSQEKPSSEQKLTIPFVIENGLIQVRMADNLMVVDFGAQRTVLPKKLFSILKERDVALLSTQVLNTMKGQTKSSPYIQIDKKITFVNGATVTGLKGVVTDLGFEGVTGILGMDFFKAYNNAKWTIDFKKHQLKPYVGDLKGVSLLAGGRGDYDALEYHCSFNPLVKVRIDTGSQVYGDLSRLSKNKVKKCFLKSERFELQGPNSLIFSRDVDVNLGLPFLIENINLLSFDLLNGRMKLERKN